MKPSTERVAFRFLQAAGDTPSPAALKMLKTMSEGGGKLGMVNVNLLSEVLGLIGWSITEKVGAARLNSDDQLKGLLADFLRTTRAVAWGYPGVKDPKEFWFTTEEAAAAGKVTLMRHIERVSAKGPSNPERGKLYVASVEGPVNDSHDSTRWIVRTMFWWLGVPGWTLSNGADSVELLLGVNERGGLADPTSMKLPGFWTWGYKNGLQAAAKKFLDEMGAEKFEQATRPESARTLDGTGTCPACFQNVKLTAGTMMRHGWQVKGRRSWGEYGNSWHTSACFGFHWKPYEESKEGTEAYLNDALKPAMVKAEAMLQELLHRPPASIMFQGLRGGVKTVDRPEGFVRQPNPPWVHGGYATLLEKRIEEVQEDLLQMRMTQRTLEAKIQSWTPQPLPGSR